MSTYLLTSRFAPSDIERGLQVIRQFKNVVYLVDSLNGEARELVSETIRLWNESEPGAKARAWDTQTKPTFDDPFVGVATLSGFRQIEKDAMLANRLRFVLCNKVAPDSKRDQRVLIIGATAFLGKAIYEVFCHTYKDVVGTGFKQAQALGLEYLDITDQAQVSRFFDKSADFDIVVYVSGEANADIAERNQKRAHRLNTEPANSIAKKFKTGQFVYISTEYVFDGQTAPYTSYSDREPKNYYGQTKKEAEDLTLKNFDHPIVIRMGALYGYNGPEDKKTTVGGIMQNLNAGNDIDVDELQIKHPILLEDAVLTLVKLLDYKAEGIYQANGAVGVNKVELAKQMAQVWSQERGDAFTKVIRGNRKTDMSDKPKDTNMVNVDTPRSIAEGIRFMIREMNLIKSRV
jgi:S-adenosylmethionine synthetase